VPSLVLGCEKSNPSVHKNYSMLYSSHISWTSPTTPTPLELYPALAFDRLFKDEAQAGDTSVLDAVLETADDLRRRISVADRRKLDEYLDSVRDVEARIAGAGDVRFQMPRTDTYEGVPVQVTVEVRDAADAQPPRAPEVPGATVRVLERGRQQMSEFRNGRMKSSTTVTYAVEITPERVGAIEIPPITVTVDGRDYASPAHRVEVRPSDAGDLMTAEIFGQPPEVYIGQPLQPRLPNG